MATHYEEVQQALRQNPKTWLVTGAAGFIGSSIVEKLLCLGQSVVGLDNFATGYQKNLDEIKGLVSEEQWQRFRFQEGDICNLDTCRAAVKGVDHVSHQAALGSVPRSIESPLTTNAANIDGFLNMLVAARDEDVDSFTYAASSSTYGDAPELPKVEGRIGSPLSPYAVTKYVNELYADVFARCYDFKAIGLRYFNVFGRRQDPDGAYAAVIPRWIAAMINGETVTINGDGETSRDFCYIDNTVQANLLAACAPDEARDQVYNVAVNARTSLNELFDLLRAGLAEQGLDYGKNPAYAEFRPGDVRHSQADIAKAKRLLGYQPAYDVQAGLREAMQWYYRTLSTQSDKV